MITIVGFVFGVLLGFAGFLEISISPFPGISALFLGGSLVLASIDRMCHTQPKNTAGF
jgi:hypothetical protein